MTISQAKPFGRFRVDSLLRPSSVAVIGAGTPEGAQVMANLLAGGFKGAILPVDRALRAVSGVLAYPDIASLPIAPDLAVIACPVAETEAALQALATRGTHAAVAVGMAGDLAALAKEAGGRVLGPGSFGISVPEIGLNASRSHLQPRPGRLALVSQSAALCRAVLDWAEPNGVGFSHIVGIGGNADIGFALVLDWLARDPGTGAILLDIRRIRNSRAFLSAARAASRLRPMVAIRAGGRLLDPTGASDRALDAALRRAGILSVSRLEDLLAAAETLTRARPARHDALAIVTNAIGPAQMAADAALKDGLHLARLSDATRDVLRALLPVEIANGPRPGSGLPGPESGVIYVGPDAPMRLAEVAALLSGAKEVGGVLVVHAPTGEVDGAGIEALAACAKSIRAPLLVCVMGETTAAAHRRTLAEAGVPVFAVPEQAVRGFQHLVQDRRNRAAARELPPSTVLALAPDRGDVRRIFARVRRAGRLSLAQDEAMSVLSAYGIPVVPGRAAATPADAAAAASVLGFPVVVKLRRTDRAEETARGGVALDLRSEDEVERAARLLEMKQARAAPDEAGMGLLVQRLVGRSRELRIGVSDDATFGPIITFGQGGTAAEIMQDVAADLPPLNLPLAHALIARTRVAGTLVAFHDQSAANEEAVADTLVRISQLIVDFPEIGALDVNPLFVDADGVLAADAWIELRAPEPGGWVSRLAISPYPAELVERFACGDEVLTIRPIRPEDAAAHAGFFTRLSPEDIRYRFFSAMRELSPEQIARMTQVDYDREMAFVAVRENGDTVGVSRLVCEPGGESGEFAVIVQADMKGRGLARRLMQRLIDWGRAQGMAEIDGQVLANNAPMLAFVRRLGFEVHRMKGEDDVVEARLALTDAPA